jgi:hypothetical protein
VTVLVLSLVVAEEDGVMVALPVVEGGAGAPTVVVTVDVDVDVDMEVDALAPLGGEMTPHATRLPESPVASVSWSGPGVPLI